MRNIVYLLKRWVQTANGSSLAAAILCFPLSLCLTSCRTAESQKPPPPTVAAPQAAAPDPTAPIDQDLLRRAGAEWDRLFNAGDTAGLAAQYAEDALSMPYNAPTVRGRKAIQAELDKFLADNTAKHETSIDEVLTSGDGWAIERARYTMTITPKAGGAKIVETGRHVMCRKKVADKWQIAWEIWNTDQPPK